MVEAFVDGSPAPVTDNGNGTYTMQSVVTLNPAPESCHYLERRADLCSPSSP